MREAHLHERGDAVEEAHQKGRRGEPRLGRNGVGARDGARGLVVGLVKVEDGGRLVRLHADVLLDVGHLDLAPVL